MKKVDEAILKFNEGFNCSQAIFSTYGPLFDFDQNSCLRIAELFGAGMAYSGNICGAVTGSLMVLGLKSGRQKAEDIESKYKANKQAKEFLREFKEQNNSILCRYLINTDISTEEKLEKAREQNVFANCADYVRDAAEILEKMLKLV
jgi:C_GCAxxG_C_C family probable redox protein